MYKWKKKHNETWNISFHFFLLSFSKVQDDARESGASSTKKERKGEKGKKWYAWRKKRKVGRKN